MAYLDLIRIFFFYFHWLQGRKFQIHKHIHSRRLDRAAAGFHGLKLKGLPRSPRPGLMMEDGDLPERTAGTGDRSWWDNEPMSLGQSLLTWFCWQPDYTFKPGHSPKQLWYSSWTLSVPRQLCDWSLSTEAVSCLQFAWLWHLSSGCHSYELEAAQTWQMLPCHTSLLVLLTASPVPACCDGLELIHRKSYGFFLGSSLILIKVIHKQPTLPRPLFHFLSG